MILHSNNFMRMLGHHVVDRLLWLVKVVINTVGRSNCGRLELKAILKWLHHSPAQISEATVLKDVKNHTIAKTEENLAADYLCSWHCCNWLHTCHARVVDFVTWNQVNTTLWLQTRDDVSTSMGRASTNPTQVQMIWYTDRNLWLTRGSGIYG